MAKQKTAEFYIILLLVKRKITYSINYGLITFVPLCIKNLIRHMSFY